MFKILKKFIFNNQKVYSILKVPIDFLRWKKQLYRNPSPAFIKRGVIRSYGIKNSILIETGTFKGNLIVNLNDHFSKCITVEPIDEYFEIAKKNLNFLKNKVQLIKDKSENCFENIINSLDSNKDVTFFLDGHSISNEEVTTSILFELEIIKKNLSKFKDIIIIIDDLRIFDQEKSYPKKIDIIDFAIKNHLSYTFESDMFILSNNSIKVIDFKDRRKNF